MCSSFFSQSYASTQFPVLLTQVFNIFVVNARRKKMQKCPYLTSCQKASHTLSQADFLKQFPLGIFEGSLETPLGTFDFESSNFRQVIFFSSCSSFLSLSFFFFAPEFLRRVQDGSSLASLQLELSKNVHTQQLLKKFS